MTSRERRAKWGATMRVRLASSRLRSAWQMFRHVMGLGAMRGRSALSAIALGLALAAASGPALLAQENPLGDVHTNQPPPPAPPKDAQPAIVDGKDIAERATSNPVAPIRVNVNLVRVVASVRDQSGGLVSTLQKSDFQILDNGAPQEVALFERSSQ